MNRTRKRTNNFTAGVIGCVVVGMVGLTFAAVPLYRMFCQVTGWGGTTQKAEAAPAEVSDTIVTVRFNADVAKGLPWVFRPLQDKLTVRLGESALAFFAAENRSDRSIVGTAAYNVTPTKVGSYFSKIECFCFTEQVLAPGQRVEMPVSFYVEPALADDPKVNEVRTITLSYTFFEAGSESLDRAPELTQ
jgi:cytochrome c oxidase assembly protein subunit 11